MRSKAHMKFKRRVKIEKGMVDLTPLVNIFFLLFIFFLFTSSFIFQPGIKVSLPKAVTSEVMQQDDTVIIVTKDDRIYLDDREMIKYILTKERYHRMRLLQT